MAVASAVGIGLFSFTPKVAAMRGYDATLFTCYSNITATIIGFFAIFLLSDFSGWANIILLFALGNGLLHTTGKIFRVDALRYIDTTIFFPLYKIAGPLIIIAAAMLFFSETFSLLEWTGIVLSLLVPLMLISKSEHTRQNNLLKGLQLMFLTALFTALAGVVNKMAADHELNVYLFVVAALAVGSIYSFGKYCFAHRKENVGEITASLTSRPLITLAVVSGFFQYAGLMTYMLALEYGASLGIAFTINSLYILIPIVLSIIFYSEHWNARKATAIILSIVALGLMR